MVEKNLKRVLNGLNQDPDLWKKDKQRPIYRQQEILYWIVKNQSDEQIADKIASTRGSVYNQRIAISAMFQPFDLNLDDASIRAQIEALFKEKLPTPPVHRREVPWPHLDFELEDIEETVGPAGAEDDNGASRDKPEGDLATELFAGVERGRTSPELEEHVGSDSGDESDGEVEPPSNSQLGLQEQSDGPRSRITLLIGIALVVLLAIAIIIGGIFFIRWGQQNLFCPVLGIGCEISETQDLVEVETESTQEPTIEPTLESTPEPTTEPTLELTLEFTEEPIPVDIDAVRTEAAMTVRAQMEVEAPPPTNTRSIPTDTPPPTGSPEPTYTPTPSLVLPFVDDFNDGLDPHWLVLDGEPFIDEGKLRSVGDRLDLQIGDDSLGRYSVKFDFTFDFSNVPIGYTNFLTWGRELQYAMNPGGTAWKKWQDNEWIDIVAGEKAGWAGTLEFRIDEDHYQVYYNDDPFDEIFYGSGYTGPLKFSIHKSASIDNFEMNPLP